MRTILVLLLITALRAHAQLVLSFAGGNDVSVGPGTAGLEFTSGSTAITIDALGVFATSGALFNSHQVGLWDNTPQHNLVGQVDVVPGTATLQGGFWYENLGAPITLPAGQSFFLAAQYADNDFDLVRANATAASMGGGATPGSAVLSSGTGFTFPDVLVPGADLGFFGPNAAFAPVPEPPLGVAAVGLGLLGFGCWRRRDRTRYSAF